MKFLLKTKKYSEIKKLTRNNIQADVDSKM